MIQYRNCMKNMSHRLTREYIDDKVAREISARERTRRADRTARREESQLEESEIV